MKSYMKDSKVIPELSKFKVSCLSPCLTLVICEQIMNFMNLDELCIVCIKSQCFLVMSQRYFNSVNYYL